MNTLSKHIRREDKPLRLLRGVKDYPKRDLVPLLPALKHLCFLRKRVNPDTFTYIDYLYYASHTPVTNSYATSPISPKREREKNEGISRLGHPLGTSEPKEPYPSTHVVVFSSLAAGQNPATYRTTERIDKS